MEDLAITPAFSAKGPGTTLAHGRPDWVDRQAFPFRSRRLELARGGVHYVDEGAGEPVLLVHGTPTWSFEYRHLIRALARQRRVIALDNLGFGLSDRPRDFAYTPEAHAEVLREFVDRLGLGRFALVTHDYGGPFALPLALDAPDRVEKLVLFNTWLRPFDDPAMRRGARLAGSSFGRFLYRRLNFSLRVLMPSAYGDRRKLTPALHRQYLEPFRDVDARSSVLWPLARALTRSEGHFESLWQRRARLANTDTLILWGMRDRALPPALLERLREGLPHARVEAVEEAGHWPHEEAPERVNSRVAEFLSC